MVLLKDVFAGDMVCIDQSIEGIVVFCSESDSYLPSYPRIDWPKIDYSGVMITQKEGGLIFHDSSAFFDGALEIEIIRSAP